MTVPRLVLDASVVLAALLTPNRRSASCLLVEAIGTDAVQLVVSAAVMAEHRRTVEERAAGSRLDDPLGLVLDLGTGVRILTSGDVLRSIRDLDGPLPTPLRCRCPAGPRGPPASRGRPPR